MKKILLFCLVTFFTAYSTYAQVTQINSNNSLHVQVPLPNNKTILVSDVDNSIWATDGTLPNTIQISPNIKFEAFGGILSGKLIFSGNTATTGSEIYITDGTPGGTLLVKDIYSGATSSAPGDFTLLNGFVFFSARTAAEGRELWKTDGTSGGTTLLKDIVPGTDSSNNVEQYNLFSNGTYLLFAAHTAGSGVELWKSNGTTAGTVFLKEINTGNANADSSNPRDFYALNSVVLFAATDGTHGEEIWKTDGTPGGTIMLKDINAGTDSSTYAQIMIAPGFFFPAAVFSGFHTFNNRAYFNAYDGSSTGEIWGTDGTPGNTTLLKDVVPGTSISQVFIIDAENLPAKFIFPVSDGNTSELWESDGTPANTKLFKAFMPNNPGETPIVLLTFSFDPATGMVSQPLFQGNKFFFTAPTTTEGYELWISDGTLVGTLLVKDINPGPGNGIDLTNGFSFVYTTTHLFFAANDGPHGNELWKSDGTAGGTTMVADIYTNTGDANPELTLVCNGKIIFPATNGDDPVLTDLYVVNGTFAPLPIQLTDFTVSKVGNDALLQWNTLQEINTKDFTIQRSFDALHFQDIGNIPAAGTSSNKHAYSFTDAGIITSGRAEVYYRLLAKDKDGKTESSKVLLLKLRSTGWGVRLLQNPVKESVSVLLSGITGNIKLSIKDINGKAIFANTFQNVNGQLTLPANFEHGAYILIAENNNERKVMKFIK